MKSILITGGAGYIGTNIVYLLAQKAYKIFIVDNFTNSFPKHIETLKSLYPDKIFVYNFDLQNKELLEKLFSENKIDAVIHLAGKKYIPESFLQKEKYYLNNVTATEILLKTMTKFRVNKLVFPSSLTVYGNQKENPIEETRKLSPLSPYAETKVIGEQLIETYAKENENKAIVLRLSNPLGAQNLTETDMLGDHSTLGTKGVLNYFIKNAENGTKVELNGGNHATKDGTTIRNYIHVQDVAKAFCFALEKDFKKNSVLTLNIGGLNGISVLELLHGVEKVTKCNIEYSFKNNLDGDPDILVSDIKKAKTELNFEPVLDLNSMIKSAKMFYNLIKKEN